MRRNESAYLSHLILRLLHSSDIPQHAHAATKKWWGIRKGKSSRGASIRVKIRESVSFNGPWHVLRRMNVITGAAQCLSSPLLLGWTLVLQILSLWFTSSVRSGVARRMRAHTLGGTRSDLPKLWRVLWRVRVSRRRVIDRHEMGHSGRRRQVWMELPYGRERRVRLVAGAALRSHWGVWRGWYAASLVSSRTQGCPRRIHSASTKVRSTVTQTKTRKAMTGSGGGHETNRDMEGYLRTLMGETNCANLGIPWISPEKGMKVRRRPSSGSLWQR